MRDLFKLAVGAESSVDDDVDMSRDFTPTEQIAVTKALATSGNEVVVDACSVPLLGGHVQCLHDKRWLNDEVVNFHVELLRVRAERRHACANAAGLLSVEAAPRCHFFNSFFYLRLTKTADGPYVYKNVQRWTRKLGLPIFACNLVLLPIHVRDSHWCLVSIDMRAKTLRYWDSLCAGIDAGCLQVCGALSSLSNSPSYACSD